VKIFTASLASARIPTAIHLHLERHPAMADNKIKTFRVITKEQGAFTVKAHHFKANAPRIEFYKSETEKDEDVLVYSGNVVAIIPSDSGEDEDS
jgi:hypothetical protein